MINRRRFMLHGIIPWVVGGSRGPEPSAFPQEWDPADAMQAVARRSTGQPGVVLHVGDSIPLDPAYAAWPLSGRGRSPADGALLRWLRAGARDESDGWWLCSTLLAPKKSATAFAGVQLRQLLVGELSGVTLEAILRRFRPQVVVLLIGTNDATVRRSASGFAADLRQAVELMTGQGIVPVLSTLPPHARQPRLARRYNVAIHSLARTAQVPLIDFHGEILRRRPTDWNGTLLERDGLHPTAGALPTGEPTEAELADSGYRLGAWLSAPKFGKVKERGPGPRAKK